MCVYFLLMRANTLEIVDRLAYSGPTNIILCEFVLGENISEKIVLESCRKTLGSAFAIVFTNTIINMRTVLLKFFTGSNEDGLVDSAPSCIGHCDCDTVVSTTLQLLYSVAGGGNTTTSPTSLIIISPRS